MTLTLDRFSPADLRELATLMDKGQKTATGTPTTYLLHGNGGLLATPGVDRALFSTVVKPDLGVLSALPWYSTDLTNPLFSIITGVRDDTGTERSTDCGDCLVAGIKKVCTQTAVFGKFCRETREFNVNTLGARMHRHDPDDLRLVNPLFDGMNVTPNIGNLNPLANDIAQALVEVAISFQRLLAQQLWTGDPANNVGTAYMEFPGLDILVSTGKVDALTNTSCPSVNSDIKDYAYQDVCEGTPSIVEVLTYLYRYLAKNARTMQLDPVDFRFTMREELFYELTSCWPCSYITFRCFNRDTAFIDPMGTYNAADMVQMRDAMRNGRYLLIDGKQIPVLLDDGIPEDSSDNNGNLQDGEFSSDIYLLPFSAMGGTVPTLYGEYFDYRIGHGWLNQAPGAIGADHFETDNGMYAWTFSRINNCILWLAEIQPRVILRTPFLAGKLQNVKYEPLQHTRQPFPDDGYFTDGGRVTTTAPSYYSEWSRGQSQ